MTESKLRASGRRPAPPPEVAAAAAAAEQGLHGQVPPIDLDCLVLVVVGWSGGDFALLARRRLADQTRRQATR